MRALHFFISVFYFIIFYFFKQLNCNAFRTMFAILQIANMQKIAKKCKFAMTAIFYH